MPTLQLFTIDATVRAFFSENYIMTEDGLSSLIPDYDIPDRDSYLKGSYWKMVLFPRSMSTVIAGCYQFQLLPNTPYNLLLKHNHRSASGVTPEQCSAITKVYSLKTVAAVTLDPCSGLTSDFKD